MYTIPIGLKIQNSINVTKSDDLMFTLLHIIIIIFIQIYLQIIYKLHSTSSHKSPPFHIEAIVTSASPFGFLPANRLL